MPTLLVAALALFLPYPALAQEEAVAVLRGRALLGDGALRDATVVLHLVSPEMDGELDSVRVDPDGRFSFRLPRVPDPERSEIFFASVRHQDILYFGGPVTAPIQLDSLYTIQAYDTAVVADAGGARLAVQVRNLFLEPDEGAWRVTDLLQIRNDTDRTLVAAPGGLVWRYPIPELATEPTLGQSDLVPGGSAFEDGHLVIRSPIPPGERLFVVRYGLPDPFVDFPTPSPVEVLDILVREPAPPLDAPGLTAVDRIQLEPGTTYRRFSAEDFREGAVRLVEAEEDRPLPVRWFAVAMAVLLAVAGLWAVLGAGGRAAAATPPEPVPTGREAVILEIARLDEAFEAQASPGEAERAAYRRKRQDLLSRLR